jgi:hypothetical protein
LKRLDQGHLVPKLEVPRLTGPGQESNLGLHCGRRALEKRAIQTAYLIVIENLYSAFKKCRGHPFVLSLSDGEKIYKIFL